MKIITTAILTLTSVLLAQAPPDTGAPGARVVVAGGAMGVQTFQVLSGQLVGGSPVTGAPYSAVATTEMTQTLADGSHIVHNSSATLYRDSLGRERREESLANPGATSGTSQAPQMVFISDPVAGANYMLDANSHTAHRVPAPTQLPAQSQASSPKGGSTNTFYLNGVRVSGAMALPPPPSGPVASPTMIFRSAGNLPEPNVEDLGSTAMEGVQAQGTRSTVTIPAGQAGNDHDLQIVDERWYSPDLKVTVLSRHSDPRMGETVYRMTQINRAEPLPSMFEVPADYKITDGPVMK